MQKSVQVPNIFGENLDVLITGPDDISKVKAVNVYVHGFGTDKNEGFASFLDLSNAFNDQYINIRFDQSGYGKSEGKDYKFSFFRSTSDVKSVLIYAKKNYPKLPINIIAHSLGSFVTLLTMPCGVSKMIFTAIVNSNTQFIADWLKNRIISKGGTVDENDITVYKRSSGAVQLIGPDFWKVLRNFKPITYLSYVANCSQVHIFKPIQDDVLPNKYFEEYKEFANTHKNVFYYEVNGDHNYTKPEDRKSIIAKIKKILE